MQDSKIFRDYVSPKRLLNVVKEVSNYHRIQASPMFREAAEHVLKICKGYGLDAELLDFESTPETWYLQCKMFKEWSIKAATLDLVDPEMRLADFSADNISVVQKSYPIDRRNDPVDLVLLDKGPEEGNYEGLDLKGKWVFSRYRLNTMDWIYKRGALGLVTDFIMETANRKRSDLYDSMTYTSYWHKHLPGEPEARGFVLSPKAGDSLAKLCKEKMEKDNGYLQVRPFIDSELYDGHIQDVEVTVEGKDDRVVYLAAHLCHPRSSANDNASGVSATIEAMNVINTLIKEGKIEKPQHTIKLVLMPEMMGTYPYLATHPDYENALGAMNLDMVGGRQTRFYGPITLTKNPWTTPNLINEVATYSLGEASKEASSLSGDPVALTNHRIDSFTGGSDHVIYADPSINIPCCMLGQWPDLNYHTATDTLDVIDPEVLKFSCLTAINFAYNLANLTADDLPCLYEELEKNIIAEKTKLVSSYYLGKIDKAVFGSRMAKYRRYYLDSLKTAGKLVKDADTSNAEEVVGSMFDAWMNFYDLSDSYEEYSELSTVYKRNFVGPIESLDDYRALGKGDILDEFNSKLEGTERFAMMGVQSNTVYYIDGVRTLGQVIREVSLDLGRDCKDMVILYTDTLNKLGLISEV